jgi:glycosyltransferase involved in cell wall biosynthesis
MRVLFATNDYFPKKGGLQASIDKLIQRLVARGHSCAVLVRPVRRNMQQPKILAKRIVRKLFNRPFVISDKTFLYPVYRAPHPPECLTIVNRDFNPDVMVCVVGGSHTVDFIKALCKTAGDLPIMIYIFDVQGINFTADSLCDRSHVIANAEAIASLISAYRSRPPVVPCIVEPNDYKIESTREVVLYINPHPRKGENLAWEIAKAAAGLKFVFQESWRLKKERRLEIIRCAQKLGNVEFRTATDRPSEIYRDARVLLAPYGPERPRVVDEAQANGIPVIASDVPGLDESVGPGGVLIDPSGAIDDWVSALERLHTDKVYYEKLASAAIEHSRRPEIQSDYLVQLFERELQHTVERSTA